jgi:hypothetical protein
VQLAVIDWLTVVHADLFYNFETKIKIRMTCLKQ